jgi:ubiquinone/menaquinone biosynthesis C-methylase UbiE
MKKYFIVFIFFLLATFSGFAQYAEYDWEDRDTWMPVKEIFELAGVKTGHKAADIGCNEGYLTVRLAKTVGEDGHIYAVDVKEYLLTRLEDHLAERELDNVSVILGDYDNPKLPVNELDIVIIMDSYHEMKDYKKIMKHVYTSLKPGGKLVIMEKLKSRVKNGTRSEQADAHSLSPKYVKKEMKAVDLKILKEVNNLGYWENDKDKMMWVLVAEK